MQINPIELQYRSNLIKDYRNGNADIMRFFDYQPLTDFQHRINDLKKQHFDREGLVTVLSSLNKAWSAPDKTLQHIELLADENSVVVIGGQQAGLLTGPMYTVNKIISIIKLAKEQTEQLHVPVIPVFWIAGEDHDFAEVNHTYTNQSGKVHKEIIPQQAYLKNPVSDIKLDKAMTTNWIETVFADLRETPYTKEMFATIQMCLEKSTSYVDFCARLIFELFPEDGVVLIDSGNEQVRQLEKDIFKQLIHHQEKISDAVYETIQQLQQKAYQIPLDVTEHDGHLFYHDVNNERILLQRIDGKWVGKGNEISLTTEELLEIAEETPERLSNNVVTRPIVQEILFPTLAFIAGDGEISYWASLQKAFHIMGVHVPPVVPRLSFTYVPKRINKLLEKRAVTAEYVINHDINALKLNWLSMQQQVPIQTLFAEATKGIEQLYLPLEQVAQAQGADLADMAAKNLVHMKRHLSFLEKKLEANEQEKHALVLNHFTEIANALKPNQGLQERVWSPLPFVNENGLTFIREIIRGEYSFEEAHYVVYF